MGCECKGQSFQPRPAGWRCPSCKTWVRDPMGRECARCRRLKAAGGRAGVRHHAADVGQPAMRDAASGF